MSISNYEDCLYFKDMDNSSNIGKNGIGVTASIPNSGIAFRQKIL